MHEYLDPYRKSQTEVSEIIKGLGGPTVNPLTGDKIWTSPFVESNPFGEEGSHYTLAISPEGEKTFGKIDRFLLEAESGKFEPKSINIDQITGLRGVVKKTKAPGLFGPVIYIKTLKPIAEPYIDVTGIEQFSTMRLLQIMGVRVASPLLATRYRIVTREVNGSPIRDDSNPKLLKFIERLKELRLGLISRGLWNEELKIEEHPSNYLDTSDGIVAIDPIYRHSFMFFG